MIARLTVVVPYAIAVPDGASYPAYTVELEGYQITFRPPARSDVPLKGDLPSDIQLDGVTGFIANALQFDVHKPEFDRGRGSTAFDPPLELMQRIVDSFVGRLRYVTRAAQVHPIDLSRQTTWRLRYLNDDESELSEDPELIRGRGGSSVAFSLTSLTPAVWEGMHELDVDWRPPVWDDILLDAQVALPHVGTSVVLAATALEVFIADVLESLAAGGDVPVDVWGWLNRRADIDKNPSTEEQFDFILKHFTSHSLKSEPALWQAFKELRTARNKFVHEGRSLVGGKPVTVEVARNFILQAEQIIKIVREWLPAEKQWAQPRAEVQIAFTLPLR